MLARLVCLFLLLTFSSCFAATSCAEGIPSPKVGPAPVGGKSDSAEVARLQRRLQITQLELRLYDRVEYPTSIRRLETAAKLAKAEYDRAVRLFNEYDGMYRHRYSKPFLVTLENARLTKIEAKLRLDELEDEKDLAIQFHPDRLRLFQLRVEAARDALNAVSATR